MKKLLFSFYCIVFSFVSFSQSDCYILSDFDDNSLLQFETWADAVWKDAVSDPLNQQAGNVGLFVSDPNAHWSNINSEIAKPDVFNQQLAAGNRVLKFRMYVPYKESQGPYVFRIYEDLDPDNMNYWGNHMVTYVEPYGMDTWYEYEIHLDDFNSQLFYNYFRIGAGQETNALDSLYIDDIRICATAPDLTIRNAYSQYDGKSVVLTFSEGLVKDNFMEKISLFAFQKEVAIQDISFMDNDSTILILELHPDFVINHPSIELSLSFTNLMSVSGGVTSMSGVKVMNLFQMSLITGLTENFDKKFDKNSNPFSFGNSYSNLILDITPPGTLSVTIDGSISWSHIEYNPLSAYKVLLDISENPIVSFRYRVPQAASDELFVQVNLYDNMNKRTSHGMPFTQLEISDDWREFSVDMTDYLEDLWVNPGIVDPRAISKALFTFAASDISEENFWTPIQFKGSIEFDYISIGETLTALSYESMVVEGQDSEITVISEATVFVVPKDTPPVLSALYKAVIGGKGVYVEAPASIETVLPISSLSKGEYALYVYDEHRKVLSTAYPLVIFEPIVSLADFKDVTVGINDFADKYMYEDYFSYSQLWELNFTVVSSNNNIVLPIVNNKGFTYSIFSPGVAQITVTAQLQNDIFLQKTFTVTVEGDEHNCADITVVPTIQHVLCNGQKTGAIILSVNGTSGPYSFLWSNFRTDNMIVKVPAGTYSVNITDKFGCVTFHEFTITEPEKLSVSLQLENPSCGDDNGSISSLVQGGVAPYTYLWDTDSTESSMSGLSGGRYALTVTDDNMCAVSRSIELSEQNAPIIIVDSVFASHCTEPDGAIYITVLGGTEPYEFLWNDEISTKNRIDILPGEYTVMVTDDIDCRSYATITVDAPEIKTPEISVVTVGQVDGNNTIAWLPENTDQINFYTIYAERTAAGVYEKLSDVLYQDAGIFEDVDANPLVRSWRYRISATDFCGRETSLSAEHKTMHLQRNVAFGGGVNLWWDSYEGIPFSSYHIYRTTADGEELLSIVPSTISSFSDLEATEVGALWYYVGIELPDVVDPLGVLKAESGPYSLAMSNIAEAGIETVAVPSMLARSIRVYPTITSSYVSVVVPSVEGYSVEIISTAGQYMLATELHAQQTEISVGHFSPGIYMLGVRKGKEVLYFPIQIK